MACCRVDLLMEYARDVAGELALFIEYIAGETGALTGDEVVDALRVSTLFENILDSLADAYAGGCYYTAFTEVDASVSGGVVEVWLTVDMILEDAETGKEYEGGFTIRWTVRLGSWEADTEADAMECM